MSDNNQYVILHDQPDNRGVELYGAARQLWHTRAHEVVLSGPYDCAKTFGALTKLHALMLKYPGAKALMVRKSYKSLIPSAYDSYINKILPFPPGHADCPVDVFGGGTPQVVTYPNGSTLRLGGLDVPEKVLSAEYDFVFIPQVEELTLHEWEQVANRANGRAGNTPYPQVIGDANPGAPKHWILQRNRQTGSDGEPVLKILWAKHQDNPTIYARDFSYNPEHGEERRLLLDEHGEKVFAPGGERRIAVLEALTGLRYKRGYLGLWVGAEGVVYDNYDESMHVIKSFKLPPHWRRYIVVDFGFTHPFVAQWWAVDGDGRAYMYREMYHTKRTVEQHVMGVMVQEQDGSGQLMSDGLGNPIMNKVAKGMLDYIEEDGLSYTPTIICDHDAEDRATMRQLGLSTVPARKGIREGIDEVLQRLAVAGDGRPRLYFFRDALVEIDDDLKTNYKPINTLEEIGNYIWRDGSRGKEDSVKDDIPIDRDNHGMDCVRYFAVFTKESRSGGVSIDEY